MRKRDRTLRLVLAVFGTFLFALGTNLFIVPLNLYSGGIVGLCQLLRTLINYLFHIDAPNIDIAGIIYYVLNAPILILAYKSLGKRFLGKTILCVTTMSLFLSLIPIPAVPLMGDDVLAACIVGGILSGAGSGLTLRMGGSGGGMDVIGMYLILKNVNFSVGRISLIVNFVLYSICLVAFEPSIALYSIIFAAIASFALDKLYSQTINDEVTIITKADVDAIKKDIFAKLGRGVTFWRCKGGYTNEDATVLCIVLSKYEIPALRSIVHSHDSHAFIIVKEGANVDGNYKKKLT